MYDFLGINLKKINNDVLKAFHKGERNKTQIIFAEHKKNSEDKTGDVLICFDGHCLFRFFEKFFPFNIDYMVEYGSRNNFSLNIGDGIYNTLENANDEIEVKKIAQIAIDKTDIVIFSDETRNLKIGVNKKYLDYVNFENCRFFASAINAPLVIQGNNEHEKIGLILPIKPVSGNWDI